MKKIIFASLALTVIIYGVVMVVSSNIPQKSVQSVKTNLQPSRIKLNTNYFSYQGQENTDALTLLKQKTVVLQDKSGLVISINGRATLPKDKEFWAFYINGKMSQVGPKQYITKSTDKIEWKVENY